MKIYRVDGTFVENRQDTAFGWNMTDIIIEETKKQKSKNGMKIGEVSSKKISSEIKIQEAESVIDFSLNEEKTPIKLENIDSKVPSKSQVASLINPCSVESKMLLSVVHHAKYKNLKRDVENLGDITSNSSLKFLIDNMGEDIERDIRHAINNYFESKEDKVLSLMMELILTDTRCGLDDIAEHPQNMSDTRNCNYSLNVNTCEAKVPKNNVQDSNDNSFTSIIDENIKKICVETCDIHEKISEIKESFQKDEIRVNTLIQNAQCLERNLRETKFLEDLLHLLNGDLHKVTMKKCPFKIFLDSSDDDEPNLIV